MFDFSNYSQVYVEPNHVDDATNAKPSNGANVANAKAFDTAHDEVGDFAIILFSQFYNPIVCLDIKDFDVYDFDPFNDHVSSNTIVCHQSPCDPKDDFLHLSMILSLVLILNFMIIMLLLRYVRNLIF